MHPVTFLAALSAEGYTFALEGDQVRALPEPLSPKDAAFLANHQHELRAVLEAAEAACLARASAQPEPVEHAQSHAREKR